MKNRLSNKSSYSAVVLIVSGMICKALGALFRLPLTNLLGIEGIGVFQLVMSLYSFALVLTSGGVATALSKLISSARARGQSEKIVHYFKYAISFCVGTGICVGGVFLIFSQQMADFQGIGSGKTYFLFVLLLPLGAVLATFRGFFQGYSNMLPTAISQVLEQVFKFVFGVLFASLLAKRNILSGVYGAFCGIVLSEAIVSFFLIVMFFLRRKNLMSLQNVSEIKFAKREFLVANSSLAISASILPLVHALEGLFIVSRLALAGVSNGFATKLFGLQSGVVGAILNFPLIISLAVTTTLLPNISFLVSKGADGKKMIEKGLKTLLLFVLPTTFGVVAILKPAVALVYANMNGPILDFAFSLAFYGAFAIVFTALMQYFVMLLQANGQFKFILVITAISGAVKVLLSFFLLAVPQVNIYALVIGNIVQTAIVCVAALARLKKFVRISLQAGDGFVLIFSTLCMFFVVYTFVSCQYFSSLVNIILGVLLGVVTYVVFSLPLLLKIFPRKKSQKEGINV